MIPLTPLLPAAYELLQVLGNTERGKNLLHKGKKLMDVAIPLTNKASQLSINFLDTNQEGNLSENRKSIQLSKPLDIVDNALSLPLSYQENQFRTIEQRITDDLEVIKGQNEILFLSNSINYFLDSHKTRTGIDRGISYALQYDIVAVCNYLKKRKELRFPGYLLHQFVSLAETLKDLNIFYASILNEGHVPSFDEEEVKEEMLREYGIDKQRGDIGIYIPHELKMKILRELPSKSDEEQKGGAFLRAFKGRKLSKEIEEEVNDIAHDALFTLKEELIANEKLEYQIVKRLKVLPDNKLIIQSSE